MKKPFLRLVIMFGTLILIFVLYFILPPSNGVKEKDTELQTKIDCIKCGQNLGIFQNYPGGIAYVIKRFKDQKGKVKLGTKIYNVRYNEDNCFILTTPENKGWFLQVIAEGKEGTYKLEIKKICGIVK